MDVPSFRVSALSAVVLNPNTASSSFDVRHDGLRRRRPWREDFPLSEKNRSFTHPSY